MGYARYSLKTDALAVVAYIMLQEFFLKFQCDHEPYADLQVSVFVDGVSVGETSTGEQSPHLLIHRLCEGSSDSDASSGQALGFRMELPPLHQGLHEVGIYT